MKLRVYIFKKKQLITAAIILSILIIGAILLISYKTRQTLNTIDTTKSTIYADINNDGKNDSIIINTDKKTGKYIVDVISSDGNGYSLEPDATIKSLGYYSSWWPLKITILDINNDKDSEIILQSSDEKGPIIHIFKCINGKAERLASGRYSIFGTIKSPEDNANIIVLGNVKNSSVDFKFLTTKFGKLSPQIVPTAFTLGKNTLYSLINFIQKEDIETSNVNIENKLVSKISKGSFLDAKLTEAKYTKYNIPSECIYLIRTTNSVSNEKESITYKARFSLTKYDNKNPEYRITQLDIVK
ncbi:VCBS repeat-containing protein [Caloramator sp. E03]|uniref:FG-GAP repeat domain-containing protein n=1 Tax=Caloramator sp. E03 TaxID=2576307 RepID=UPI0011105E96|nr:VCBS repeat-containing protein [Caloramator sp. E03]QCX32547.1 VCBS repeat-containing protein [Caloramator sp. E03]